MKFAQSDHPNTISSRDSINIPRAPPSSITHIVVPKDLRLQTPFLKVKKSLDSQSHTTMHLKNFKKLKEFRINKNPSNMDLDDIQVDLTRHNSQRAVPIDSCENNSLINLNTPEQSKIHFIR